MSDKALTVDERALNHDAETEYEQRPAYAQRSLGRRLARFTPQFARLGALGLVAVGASAGSSLAFAGEGGDDPDGTHGDGGDHADDFADIWNTLVDWTQGTLGRVIALAMVVVGIVRGIANQSIMAFAMGVGAGVGLYNADNIIDIIMGASVSAEQAAGAAVAQ